MYAKRVQIVNYGPIRQLNVEFPFNGEFPKPVVLVGKNGSGKSILLSHVVNGLIAAKNIAYPGSPEVESNRVFKIRSPFYIRSGSECYFGRVDFEDGLFMGEVMASRLMQDFPDMPTDLAGEDSESAWRQMEVNDNARHISNISKTSLEKIKSIFSKSCVLYFPPNRFEEPAWLNQENLTAQANYMGLRNIEGFTERTVIDYSRLHKNQDWLFDLIYDRTIFEAQLTDITINLGNSGPSIVRPAILGYSGNATNSYEFALELARRVIRGDRGTRFGIGPRQHRVVSFEGETGTTIPNIFQLSSGETALLNLFLSILRDFDLCGAPFSKPEDIRGIVVVDEIDLHLHSVHQYEILPSLIKMFPRVQFIVTTHSPLFVLGMNEAFGEDGFAVYRMPNGHQISPEEFSEFASAYQAFTATSKHSDEIRSAIENSRKPVVFLEGKTDIEYLRRAAELLHQEHLLEEIELKDGCGDKLEKTWKAVKDVPDGLVPGKVVVVRDCDYKGPAATKGNKRRRTIPQQPDHPVEKGIENLFSQETMAKARTYKPAFVDITSEHIIEIRGHGQTIPEEWSINKEEKSNLCDWLCEHGTAEDFKCFHVLFDLLREALGLKQSESSSSSA